MPFDRLELISFESRGVGHYDELIWFGRLNEVFKDWVLSCGIPALDVVGVSIKPPTFPWLVLGNWLSVHSAVNRGYSFEMDSAVFHILTLDDHPKGV